MILIDALRRLGGNTRSLIIASLYKEKEPIPSMPLRTVTELINCKKKKEKKRPDQAKPDQHHTERQHALIISINGASCLFCPILAA